MPELKKLIEMRDALKALKGPLGNVPAFQKKLKELVTDEGTRERLLKELGIGEGGGGEAGGSGEEPSVHQFSHETARFVSLGEFHPDQQPASADLDDCRVVLRQLGKATQEVNP